MSKISVIVPYYNSHQYFHQTLSSIQSQSYQDVEVVIVNDNSSKESVGLLHSIVEEFQNKLDIKLIHHKQNMGVAESRNTGFGESSGEYVLYLDADDMLCGRYSLEFRADFLNNNPDFDATGGYTLRIDTQSNVLKGHTTSVPFFNRSVENPNRLLIEYCLYSLKYSRQTAKVFFFISGGCLIRKSSAEGFLFDTLFDSEDDVEWTLRFLMAKNRIQLHKVPFHYWRIHDKQYHLKTPPQASLRVYEIMRTIISNNA